MKPLKNISKKSVIGMVHFSALRGDPAFENNKIVLSRAQEDLKTLLQGGVDAVLFENNFDTEKHETLSFESREHFRELIKALTPIEVPWGIAALWNDYKLGFELCKEFGGVMVRVPVFVDSVITKYGRFDANPEAVIATRKTLCAEDIQILCDVQVKHATMVNPRPLSESIVQAINEGADAVIITGKWTGDPPTPEDCKIATQLANNRASILTGSGMTIENIKDFLPFIDGCIVGSAFKAINKNTVDLTKPNIVGSEIRYDLDKVREFIQKVHNF